MSRPQSAFRGAIFTVGMRWVDRLMGFTSMLILARLLTPGDFGLVAMSTMAVALVDIFLDLGVSAALVQNSNATREDFDTAWSLRLVQATFGAVLVAVGAPLAADFFGDPRVVEIMRVIAITVVIGGLENIGIVQFQKDMQFDREFRFFVAKRATGVVLTIVLALWLRSYWALVLGSLMTRVAGVTFSYLMHPFRPRLWFGRFRAIWSFSQWNLVNSFAAYFVNRADKLYVGRRMDAAALGTYSLADEIAVMPSSELLAPLGRVMFPAFVRARHDGDEVLRLLLLSLSVQAVVAIPAGIGLAVVASEAVQVLLGNAWIEAIPVLQVLAVGASVSALSSSSYYAMMALGKMRALAAYSLGLGAALVSSLVVVAPSSGIGAVAWVRMVVVVFALVVLNRVAQVFVPGFSVRRIASEIWRPVLSAVGMAAVILLLKSTQPSLSVAVLLVAEVLTGIAVYAALLWGLWCLAGRPEGAETYIAGHVASRLRGYVAAS